ncbi:hypothetical protein QJ854_gp438 [Moumouvirus goulette]|uniref:Uncharacterized protein n=1 Tax=Moumouvirus goulette TaxID=1247379 RepID=M1PBN0_9VIRU|nr:hypothetical protein QJ854_gp438 [Moumouvirus goulette]AGF85344.1 hypothetical protein glt_00535 [Moumouvirus goulette]
MSSEYIGAIVIIILLLIIIYFLFRSDKSQNKNIHPNERFQINSNDPKQLKYFYKPMSSQLSNLTIDTNLCHPDCCGTQWPFSDGLNTNQIINNISNMNSTNNLRSNYTCARGENGIGCPCLTVNTHKLITNRGKMPNN